MQQYEINIRRKKFVGKMGVVLIFVVILLTFLSRTISNLLMPNVTAVKHVKGSLQDKFDTEGAIEYAEKHKINAEGSWKVKEVKVIPNQQIRKGELLAVIDNSDIQMDIKSREFELMKLENAIQNFKDSYKPIRLSDYEKELQLAQKEMDKAKKDFEIVKQLYEAGNESKKNVEAAEDVYNNKQYIYYSKKNALEDKVQESIMEQDKYNRALNEKMAELEFKKMELAKYRENIPEDGMIVSDMDGIIAALGIEVGMSTAKNQTLFEIVKMPCSYRAVWYLDAESSSKFKINDEVIIEAMGEVIENNNKTINNLLFAEKITGKVFHAASGRYKFWADITNEDNSKIIFLNEGQSAMVRSVVNSPIYEYLLPKSCIVQVQGKDCIFVVGKRQGALGEEYYVEQREVKILEKDDSNVAVDCYFKKNDVVVYSTSKPLRDMMQVHLNITTEDGAG